MPDGYGTIFGPHDGETYGHYLRRLVDDPTVNPAKAAAMMVTAMVMQGNVNADRPVDREQRFRMENRILLKAYRPFKFREPCIQLIHFTEGFKEYGWFVSLEECLFKFLFNTLF